MNPVAPVTRILTFRPFARPGPPDGPLEDGAHALAAGPHDVPGVDQRDVPARAAVDQVGHAVTGIDRVVAARRR